MLIEHFLVRQKLKAIQKQAYPSVKLKWYQNLLSQNIILVMLLDKFKLVQLLDNFEVLPLNIFLLVQQKIMERFKSCPAVKKVLLMDRFIYNRRTFSCSWFL